MGANDMERKPTPTPSKVQFTYLERLLDRTGYNSEKNIHHSLMKVRLSVLYLNQNSVTIISQNTGENLQE
jgi:hypothetical protein